MALAEIQFGATLILVSVFAINAMQSRRLAKQRKI
jgi:hypothetical protein